MTKIGTLKELGVKPGDVVEYKEWNGVWIRGVIRNNMVAEMDIGAKQPVSESSLKAWRLISRAAETPKLWRDMTPEEKGALLLAAHEGKVIEYRSTGMSSWHRWNSYMINDHGCGEFMASASYRVKPERTKSDWSAWFTSKQDGTTKLDLNTCAEVERVALGDGPQFAYRFKKWAE